MTYYFLLSMIVVVMLILLVCVVIMTRCYTEEGFSSLRKTRATLVPVVKSSIFQDKPLYLNNFEDYLINTTTDQAVGSKLLFRISRGSIKLINNQHYLTLKPMHVGRHFYVLAQEKTRDDIKHKWFFKKRGKGKYFLYQKLGKKRIYIYIDNDVITGSAKKKTVFQIQQESAAAGL